MNDDEEIQRGIDDMEAGRLFTVEEAFERINKIVKENLMKIKTILIPVEGPIQFLELDTEGIKSHVDGWLERLRIADDLFAWIDEEGKLKNRLTNHRATDLCFQLKAGLAFDDFIVGNVILTGPADEEGENTDVPEKYKYLINHQIID